MSYDFEKRLADVRSRVNAGRKSSSAVRNSSSVFRNAAGSSLESRIHAIRRQINEPHGSMGSFQPQAQAHIVSPTLYSPHGFAGGASLPMKWMDSSSPRFDGTVSHLPARDNDYGSTSMASFASSGNPFATTRPQQMPDFGSAPYGHDGYNMDESESDEGMDTEELERQVILMVNRRIHEKLNESSSESEEEENSGESMDEYGEVEKKKKKKKKRKKKSNPPLWGAGQFVDHGDFTRFNEFSARQQPYPYHPAMPSHDSALASKIDVIIEQNKHLQSIVKQQSEQLNSKVIGQNAGGANQTFV